MKIYSIDQLKTLVVAASAAEDTIRYNNLRKVLEDVILHEELEEFGDDDDM